MSEGLGRRIPQDWGHVEKYPLRKISSQPASFTVEDALPLEYRYRPFYDQGREGACVGFASSWMMSILNRTKYDARWLWNEAKAIDPWPDTNPGDDNGTSVSAAMDILRAKGHRRSFRGVSEPESLAAGISENRWATNVDEVRWCIHQGVPVTLGVTWYTNFDRPVQEGYREYWIGKGDLGQVRGGHAICCYGASDRRQAVKLVNSWGKRYPLVWLPYTTLQTLLDDYGEATMVVDRD